MNRRTVVIRRRSFGWQRKTKRKIRIKPIISLRLRLAGFINPVIIVLACGIFSGLFYMYSVNQTAIKGIEIRNVEKNIAEQQKNNEILKIKEAELKSLYHIEEQSKQLNMVNAASIKYLEESPSVAYGTTSKGGRN